MSDPTNPWPMLQAMAGAAVIAALAVVWNRRSGEWRPWAVSPVVGAGLGFYAGCRFFGLWPQWPPTEDSDRLLLVVVPAALATELLAALTGSRWLGWLLRLAVAASAGRILLDNSVYLTQPPGPGSMGWTPAEQWLILGCLAAALAGLWLALHLLLRRAPGRSVPTTLAFICAVSALAIMLSGYATGGPLGLSLAAAIFGVVLGSLFLSASPEANGVIGLGVVGLFSLVIVGRFFGELTSVNAALLCAAPLMCWVPELPYVKRLGARLQGVARVALTAVPLAVVLLLIQHSEKKEPPSPGAEEPGLDDYQNFGK